MTKIYFKLIAMAIALVLSVSVLIMSSYAWMVLSGNPAVSGIQVAIGGGNTILVAPNVVSEGYNIPGYFSDKLNFGTNQAYDYLREIGGLTPVSTSNGIDWFLSGDKVDSELAHANLSADEKETISKGHYIYLDFWVVSPSGDHTLRVSTGDENPDGGSFVIDLLEPVETETENSGWTLAEPEGSAAAAIRIGFLANEFNASTENMMAYQSSSQYNERYTALRGMYMEPDSGTVYFDGERFTIYEPNADYHPGDPEKNGTYVETVPKALEDHPYDVLSNTTAQLQSSWVLPQEGTSILEQTFQTAIMGKDLADSDSREISDFFYRQHLQGQIARYIAKGKFVSLAENLNDEINLSGEGSQVELSGATSDVEIIKLEQNKPQRIRMFIWLEGMDIDCAASADSARFAINIEFAGATE